MTAYKTTYLKDYRRPAYEILETHLVVDLYPSETIVTATLDCVQHEAQPLVLDGNHLTLLSLFIDGVELPSSAYQIDEQHLTIPNLPSECEITIKTKINPAANTALSGLYLSNQIFCTQCEAEGFRRITYFLDRPDVMSRYTTTVIADKTLCPILLSNGNPIDKGELSDNRHFVKWEDPFKKPSYLFALVAGNLEKVSAPFTTQSGRTVTCEVYVEQGKASQAGYALSALHRAMRWDEEAYGREYDLDIYMIVAVSDFNMGAMENKGLNIFNDKYILAEPSIATDSDYQHIETVVGHEYFHNWTGNRITCRDWFQLSLKEGLTVFREQQFASTVFSPELARIQEVEVLRNSQFIEDNGPMAHPVRPDAYQEINNFYTPTIYDKGAEVIRMIATQLGQAGFRRGMDLYFARHDGQAVTTEDFVACMADANKIDLSLFQRWYVQAGTPRVTITSEYNAAAKQFILQCKQKTLPTPNQNEKMPLPIPLRFHLLKRDGTKYPYPNSLLMLTETEQQFVLENIDEPVLPSLFNGFSAPIYWDYPYRDEDLAFLMAYDQDGFSRYESAQQLYLRNMQAILDTGSLKGNVLIPAMKTLLTDERVSPDFLAYCLSLPSERILAEKQDRISPQAVYQARRQLIEFIAHSLKDEFLTIFEKKSRFDELDLSFDAIAERSLKNKALYYLMQNPDDLMREKCYQRLLTSTNMTNVMAALNALLNDESTYLEKASQYFYDKFKSNAMVINKWLSEHARSRLPAALDRIKKLMDDPCFEITNPNKVYALIGGFCFGNYIQFNTQAGYQFVAEQIKRLDSINAQVAARLATSLTRWKQYDSSQGDAMKASLVMLSQGQLSRDVSEIVGKSLAS